MTTTAPAPQVYGGDEVATLVIDTGSSYTRVGYAGEDTPKLVVSTECGLMADEDVEMEDDTSNTTKKLNKYKVGDSANLPLPNMEVLHPLTDGIVADWDAVQNIWEYSLARLNADTKTHPLMLTEPCWNTQANKLKALEIAFESLEVPASYLVKDAVASAFAAGKGNALVLDVGSEVASVTPVIDGLVLYKPARRSQYAGDYLDRQIKKVLVSRGIDLTPRFEIKNKKAVEMGEPPVFTKRELPNVTHSFTDLQVSRILSEFKDSMCQVNDVPLTPEISGEAADRVFEFPTGYSTTFGADRLSTSESLFKPSEYPFDGETVPDTARGLSEMVVDTINASNVDVRAHLANNIVITGGGSLVQGLSDRVSKDVTQALSGLKVRVAAASNQEERRHGAWIGGSVLGSLGSFHQLWVSKQEWQEKGGDYLVEKKRFK
ncbi:YALI0F27533p [Yarrowia lipolytica CLIB122]|uniref:Actin-related protein 4 n=2 Tax=Yarrowia lipolytica TaxID=4952 RepID=ARP4_YARLI|nr:YALI0F27533p [Yarrowia lipolytica CLIB122]Q6C061.1 RecName: Full=Actin-related protein 4; AltName: Full=Actin-like protein ARP4; Short=Actin-like protein 4 [Yarrowia lipolytica CLIB122]AOW07787.1 hypothetical protein YALI1_F34928g [Yarrowia lipolytica]KAB8284588.1 actin-related protein 4 [Yarrowia lipolytica]KAE8174371.1 actin-related protein 4 [Yarrowia lipolytica]KAJ8055163.1 actin-related protein 4 [Yarrowia lipolytica]RMI99941.1 actin-related protein 4 [Yarrowia lipolytica]|eukprot:XP_505951.1 YALI0F27533p [Yarrowia lipolytica CLIB122]